MEKKLQGAVGATAMESVDRALQAIDAWNPKINAMLCVTEDMARQQATRLDELASQGSSARLLHGMTINLKDCIDLAGVPTTAATSFLRDNVASEDAFITSRLKQHGAIIMGKSNLHEWVFGPTTQSKHFGPCKNPWNTTRVPGGSSGGSGASVATDMCVVSIGSDTGGSIRIPAAFCGVAGLRPTVGRISNRGGVPVSAPYDTFGPLARHVSDIARVFSVIAGHDPLDPISVDTPVPNVMATLNDSVRGMRIGIMRRWFFDDIHPAVSTALDNAIQVFRDLGVEFVELDLGDVEKSQSLLAFSVMVADAYEVHRERIAAQPEGYGEDVLMRLKLGASVTGADYAAALRWKEGLHHRLRGVFQDVDAIISPTCPFPAPGVDYPDFLEIIRQIARYTYIWAFAQVPSLAVPCGFSDDGLPVSMQLASRWFDEPAILRLGHAFQTVTDFHLRRPA